MLEQLGIILSFFCNLVGLLIMIGGTFVLIGSVIGRGGSAAAIKGALLIALGTWVAGLAGWGTLP